MVAAKVAHAVTAHPCTQANVSFTTLRFECMLLEPVDVASGHLQGINKAAGAMHVLAGAARSCSCPPGGRRQLPALRVL